MKDLINKLKIDNVWKVWLSVKTMLRSSKNEGGENKMFLKSENGTSIVGSEINKFI